MAAEARKNVALTLSLVLASTIFVGLSSLPASTGLQFVPLIQVGPRVSVQPGVAPTCPATDLFHCYTPSQIYAAYGIGALRSETPSLTGAGETIVIVDAYGSPTALADLQTFSTTFGLPIPNSPTGPTLTIIHPTGTPTFNPAMFGVQGGWAFETSLDLQWAHAIAPKANIVLIASNPSETEGVQGFPSMFIGEQFAVNNYPGSVISQSFGVTEQSFSSAGAVQAAKFDQVYQQAAAKHITVIASSGDTGSTNFKGGKGASPISLYPFPVVGWPASDKWVTAAGGTWLQYGWKWNPSVSLSMVSSCLAGGGTFDFCIAPYLASTTSPPRTEAVWKEDLFAAATGGGLSTLYSIPSYQSSVSSISSLLGGKRGIPDISWNAAVNGGVLVYVSFPGIPPGFYAVGGTSAAAPQIAGLVALANQKADSLGKQHVGYLNMLLYSLPPAAFNDIVPQTFGTGSGVTTLDSNAEFGTGVPGYNTITGWDLTTGFGSPHNPAFVDDLVASIP